MSKQEQALVDAQLAKEQSTRDELTLLQRKIQDGLSMIDSLLKSRTEEINHHLSKLATVLITGVLQYGTPLVGSAALSTYIVYEYHLIVSAILTYIQNIYSAASSRLESQRLWIAIAVLRTSGLPELPENYTAEPLYSRYSHRSRWSLTTTDFTGLVGRLLYRIRSLSEHTSFDSATFSLFWPLLDLVIQKGGIEAMSEDDAVEQLVLALEIIRSHLNQCMLFSLFYFPRLTRCS